jgi:opacity protein-like surface antigen
MKKFLAGAAVIAVATTLAAAAPAVAESAPGKVIVFSTEVTEVTVWEDPTDCVKLPVDAHVLINQTDKDVKVYGDPFCTSPGLTVAPGFGSHVAPGSGAFSVDR